MQNARPKWGCPIDWTVYIKKMHFKSSSKCRPLFPAWTKLPPDCRRQFQAQRTRGFRTFPGKIGLSHQQPLSKWYMYAPWIKICKNHIFIFPNNSAHRGSLKSKWNAWLRQAFLVYQINEAIATNMPSAWVSLQLIGVTVGVSGISISTLPLESCREFDMMGHPVGNSLVFQKLINILSETYTMGLHASQ